jgi:hypothetical protein
MGPDHGLENLVDEFFWDSLVEEVTHTIDEDALGVTPSQW